MLRKGSEIHENKVFVEIVLSISFDICFSISVIEKVIETKTDMLKYLPTTTYYIPLEPAGVVFKVLEMMNDSIHEKI